MANHADILGQLAELKRWHDTHCADDETGINMSPEDQAKLYQLLGLSPSFINEIEISQCSLNNSVKSMDGVSPSGATAIDHMKIQNNLCEDPVQNTLSKKVYDAEPVANVVKKPFLKRGEGLTSRFKIHPDRYRLQNLPKYKYPMGKTDKKNNTKPLAITEKGKFHINTELRLHLYEILIILGEEVPTEETPFKYNTERMRKSCLKIESTIQLDELRAKMTQLCTDEIGDDSEELDSVPDAVEATNRLKDDENVKRMLDFSRKSPRVTFHSEVTKIPFENYFHSEVASHQAPTDLSLESEEEDEDDNDDGDGEDHVITESLKYEFKEDIAFNKHAFISTPVDVFKEKQHLVVPSITDEKSPRTMLVEKGSLLREKLKELEQETQRFREENLKIQKMKQEIELEKVQLLNHRKDLEKQFHEQQLKLELSYEKMKDALDEDRAKLQQKSMVPNKKLKEETKALQEKIDELEKENKNREVKHGASQTRLRCHIRTLEKENRENVTTIEALKKENKRLETENARLLRQKNNKMLSEINKNIAKLATNPQPDEKPVENKKPVKRIEKKSNVTQAKKDTKTIRSQQQNVKNYSSSEEDSDSQLGETPEVSSHYFPSVGAATGAKHPRTELTTPDNIDKENRQVLAPLNVTSGGPKREIVNDDGSKDVYYQNGNLKKISSDGMVVKVLYFNKDIKETNINEGTVKYYYAETKTWHTSYLDGLEILEFPR